MGSHREHVLDCLNYMKPGPKMVLAIGVDQEIAPALGESCQRRFGEGVRLRAGSGVRDGE